MEKSQFFTELSRKRIASLLKQSKKRKEPTLTVRLQLPSGVIGSTNTVLRKSQIVKETHSLKNNLIEIKFKPQN